MGTHLIVETADGSVNLHLGPTRELDDVRAAVREGTSITTEAFRTDALPDEAYIAVTVTVGETVYRLRDGTTLRPRWARSAGQGRGKHHGWSHHDGGWCW